MSVMETMLREAMETRRSKVNFALTDLNNIIVEMSLAVAAVSDGQAKLVLQKQKAPQQTSVYALLFTAKDDETLIRIYRFSDLGYPVACYASFEDFMMHHDGKLFSSADDLRDDLQPLLSDPASKLVRLLEYITLPKEKLPTEPVPEHLF